MSYLHGFPAREQERLYRQARFLEERVYESVRLENAESLLEVGCGVGAQTEILLERFPSLRIQGVDASAAQLKAARKRLAKALRAGRVKFTQADALKLPFRENSFDAAFICWLLEHLRDPIAALREVRRTMKPGGILYATEVMNACFFVHPYSPYTLQYAFAYNDHQWNLGGDPFVGAKLANYLMAAGFQNVATEVKFFHYDNRAPKKRAEFIEYWTNLLLSGAPQLLKARRVTPKVAAGMKAELTKLKSDPDAVVFDAWVQARAQVF